MNRQCFTLVLVGVLIAFVVGGYCGYNYNVKHIENLTDTIIFHDTTKIYLPIAKERKQLGEEIVRLPSIMWVVEENSKPSILPDSVDVSLAVEQVVYEEDNYRAVVEGYQPKLVEMELRGTTTTIVKTIPTQKKGWDVAVGPTVCWGLTYEGWRLCVGIGGTITWRF